MASRKEERERLRQIRQEAEDREKKDQRRRLMLGYGVAGIIGIIVLIGIFVVVSGGGGGASGNAHISVQSGSTNSIAPDDRTGTRPRPVKVSNLDVAAKRAGCVLRENLPDYGHKHVAPGTKIHYKTNPPTSGDHVQPPLQQADGAYSEMPIPIDFVHSMEHGRLEIQYSPSLPESQQLDLKGLYDTMYGATLLFPNNQMPYKVAVVSWRNLMGCKSYKGAITLDAIRDFGKKHWGHGREPVGGFGPITGPTPDNPSL